MRRKLRRGVTLIEVMIAIGLLTLVASLVYGAFDGLARTRKGLTSHSERFHQGRVAISRMSREIQSAFLSLHRPLTGQSPTVSQTAFVGTDGGRFDRLDLTSFSHRRLGFGQRESDQNELSYFLTPDPSSPKSDLARRESKHIDIEPQRGGLVQVLAYDAESLEFAYLDPLSGSWQDSWNSTSPSGQFERLPRMVAITLVLNRENGGTPYRFVTKVPVAIQAPLMFGLPL